MSNIKQGKSKPNQNLTKKVVPATKQGTNTPQVRLRSPQVLLWLAGIILLTSIAFSPSLKNGFTNWDDNVYIGENALIKSLSGDNIKKMFNTENYVSNNYHPITILSLAVDYKISGYHPKTYHLTNLLFHLLNTALVFWFIFLLSGKKIEVAAIVALFFGIHPMHVESVAWISERKDVMYTFFFMAALIAYYKYIHTVEKNKFLLYGFILILFLLSILSKAMAVVLPLLLLLIDYYTGRKFNKYTILEKLPFFALSLLFGILASHIQSGAIAKFETFTWLQRIGFASYGMINYIYNLFIPLNLSCFYPYPNLIEGRLPMIFYIAPFIVLGLFIVVFLSIKKNKILAFGFLFFCITIALVLQFISVGQVIMADRYTYVSFIGLLFPIAMGYEWLQHQTEKKLELYKKISMLLLLLCVALSFWLTYERTKVWKNSDVLWTDAIQKYPSSEPYRNRGSYLVNKAAYDLGEKRVGENEYDRALEDFNMSIKMSSINAKVYINRANIYGLKNQFNLALSDYSKAIELDKTDAQTFFNRAITYSIMKQFDKAAADYTTALSMQPGFAAAKENRAYVYVDNGNYEKAIADLNELIQLNSSNSIYYFYRGFAYFKMENIPAALADNTTAIQLNPDYSAAYFNRSVINKGLGKFKDALEDALKAQSLGYTIDTNYLNELKSKQN